MNNGVPFVVLLLVGTGAYFLGRYDKSQTAPVDVPKPPIPTLTPPPEALMTSYDEEWDSALERYDIDVYPPEAIPTVRKLLPPPTVDGISVSPDCQTVAVGDDWWEVVNTYAEDYKDRPAASVAAAVMKYLAPTCLNRATPGALGLQQALIDWLRENDLVRNQEPKLTKS